MAKPTSTGEPAQAGFTYLGLMLMIAIAGIALAAAGTLWHREVQREKELELLFTGDQYRQAIKSYYDSTPAGVKQFPRKLEDLLEDKRFPQTKRHLRKLYPNPLSADAGWSLIKEQDRIIGVYADSDKTPLKRVFKYGKNKSFTDALAYKDWQFIYKPGLDEPTSNTPLVIIPVPLGRPENLATPHKPAPEVDDPCDKSAQVDYAVCRGVCRSKTFEVCKACYQSLRDRQYACRHNQSIGALITSQ